MIHRQRMGRLGLRVDSGISRLRLPRQAMTNIEASAEQRSSVVSHRRAPTDHVYRQFVHCRPALEFVFADLFFPGVGQAGYVNTVLLEFLHFHRLQDLRGPHTYHFVATECHDGKVPKIQ